ncbi:GGDEF domain-containing protein [Uliginosibacterium sediminicola]|uniref:diguanylate cyclase n=1 Tax=Uliginosibacterium sediminicola TaxID=2024550 RepID=A0ABU9YXR9_9RHOO
MSSRYRESVEQSAEFLRLALPLMAKQAAALHPVSYAVWYEYVAGTNLALKKAVDENLQRSVVLDDAQVETLYRKHIAEVDEDTARRVSVGFQRVLADISQSAQHAGEHAHRFGHTLETLSGELSSTTDDVGSNIACIAAVLDGTRDMQNAIVKLKQRLDDSRSEIEQLRQEVERARGDALADALTGLSNRRGFDAALGKSLEALDHSGPGLSLLMTDIDHFKHINDQYGHLFGDKVIRAVAQILKQNIKGRDTAARYGGEEFVILLPDTSLDGARAVAEKIRASIERSRIRRADNALELANITISVGVTRYQPGESPQAFIGRADNALYASKHSGRNRVTALAA